MNRKSTFAIFLLLAASSYALPQDPPPPESSLQTRYSIAVIDDATFYSDLSVPSPTVLNQVLLEPNLSVRYRNRWTFSSSLVGIAATYDDTSTQLNVKETYAGLSAGDFDFMAGRKIVRWGTGYAFTAAGVLDPPRDPTNPSDRLNVNEGRDMLKADWVRGHHALTFAWSTAALAPAHSEQHDTTAFRYNVLVRGFDTSLIAGNDRGQDTFGGITFTRVVGQAWELHGEAMWREQAAVLLGAKCTTSSGVTFIGEFYAPPNTPYYRDSFGISARRTPELRLLLRKQKSPQRTSRLEGVGRLRIRGHQSQRPQRSACRRYQPLVRQALLFLHAHGNPNWQQHVRLWLGALCKRDLGGSPLSAMNETIRPGSANILHQSEKDQKRSQVLRLQHLDRARRRRLYCGISAHRGTRAHLRSGGKFLSSLIYSTLIGLPTAFLLNWVGFRYSERFPRLIFLIYIAVLFCTATVGCFAGAGFLQVIGIVPHGFYWREIRTSFPICIVITLVVGLSITSYETLRHRLQSATLELRTRQMEQERANKLLVEARLSSLESRIHPHFLFNTLNSIASLIPTDPKRAEDTVGKLASLLRFSLNANHASLVPLAQELKIVRDYLEIESTRFGPRLRYQISVPETLSNLKVPPLALQTLVENSVKHVAAQRSEGSSIQIDGETSSAGSNSKSSTTARIFPCGNLTRTRARQPLRRLELLYGDRGQLDVSRADDKTVTRICFPAET